MASDPEPVFPGLSPDDVITLYFTKTTNHPDVTNVSRLLTFQPPLATVVRATWQSGGDALVPSAAQRLVVTLGGTVNPDIEATLVTAARVSLMSTGGLRDAAGASQVADVQGLALTGTWGDASQPQFLSTADAVLALDLGGQPGLGPGDGLLLRFNQPVRRVPVATKAAIDSVLAFEPPGWAASYTGQWLEFNALLITVGSLAPGAATDPGFRRQTSVGSLGVTVLPQGNLTSLDGTSEPCNATVVVAAGSWGDPVCNVSVHVHSHAALVVAFVPSPSASYTPSSYTIQVQPQTDPGAAAAGQGGANGATVRVVTSSQTAIDVALPGPTAPSTLKFVVPGLVRGTSYVALVAVAPPQVAPEVLALLPDGLAVAGTSVDSTCSCGALVAGAGCSTPAPASSLQGVAPQLPEIRTWVGRG